MIYILSTYEENGAEDVKVTNKIDLLPEIMETYVLLGDDLSCERERLKEFIADPKLGRFNLSIGWGGIQLHAVQLWESMSDYL